MPNLENLDLLHKSSPRKRDDIMHGLKQRLVVDPPKETSLEFVDA
jgi:hypothetical protein